MKAAIGRSVMRPPPPPPRHRADCPFTRRESSHLFKTPVKRPARAQIANTHLLSAPPVRAGGLGGRHGFGAQGTAMSSSYPGSDVPTGSGGDRAGRAAGSSVARLRWLRIPAARTCQDVEAETPLQQRRPEPICTRPLRGAARDRTHHAAIATPTARRARRNTGGD